MLTIHCSGSFQAQSMCALRAQHIEMNVMTDGAPDPSVTSSSNSSNQNAEPLQRNMTGGHVWLYQDQFRAQVS